MKTLRFVHASIVGLALLAACGPESGEEPDSGPPVPSVLGTWETAVDTVTITVVFSGTAESGTVQTMQSVPIDGDLATCRSENVGNGTFVVTGTSIVLDTPSGVVRTVGCSFPDSETPIDDVTPLQNFAGALSGTFVLTETTLTLGAAYPQFTLVTR